MTVRFRLDPRPRNALAVAVVAVAVAIAVTTVRMRRSSAAFTTYMSDYSNRGGPFVHPTDLERQADIDKLLFAAALVAGLVLWAVVAVVGALWLPKLRLDDRGLRWATGYWPRWRGPIDANEVISLQPEVETAVAGKGLPGAFLARGVLQRLGAHQASILYLRSDAGFDMRRLKHMQIPAPPPTDARSFLLIRQPVLASNPDFLRKLRGWIIG